MPASSEQLRKAKDDLVRRVVEQAKQDGLQPTEEKAERVVVPIMEKAERVVAEADAKRVEKPAAPAEVRRSYRRIDGDVYGVVTLEDGKVVHYRQVKQERRRPLKEAAFQSWFAFLMSQPEWKARVDRTMYTVQERWKTMNQVMEIVDESLVKLKHTPQWKQWGSKITKTPRAGAEGWGRSPLERPKK